MGTVNPALLKINVTIEFMYLFRTPWVLHRYAHPANGVCPSGKGPDADAPRF